jgi:chaperone required for assembly of F1-ATPase
VKRFWTSAEAVAEGSAWAIRLDDKQVRTPAKAPLRVPTEALAQAIAEEWNGVDGEIDPRSMPLTGLANAAIDQVAPDIPLFAASLARYAEADLACYRADWPPELVGRQAEAWDALLAWARRRYDVDFAITSSLMHVPQPPATIERLKHEVGSLDRFCLAGLSPLVTAGGSLLAALAVLEKAMSVEEAWESVSIDDRWQLEKWGSDPEATAALEQRRRDFLAGARLLELLGAN